MILNPIQIRRDIHANPELSRLEFKTSKYVQEQLRKIGIPFETMAETGVVGFLNNGKKRTIIFRCELDALPIQEATGLDFASKTPGIMHACGHDTHMAILLATAERLKNIAHLLDCNVKFVFQPDEEDLGGAKRMIDAGLLGGKHPAEAAFAFHVWPEFLLGQVGIKEGVLTSTCDEFEIEIEAKGGHIGRPKPNDSALHIGAEIVHKLDVLQRIKHKNNAIIDCTIFETQNKSIGVTPAKVVLKGGIRVLDINKRSEIFKEVNKILASIMERREHTCKLTFKPKVLKQYVPTFNDPQATARGRLSAISAGAQIINIEKPLMIAEDFSCFAHYGKIPASLILLGCSTPQMLARKGGNQLHTPNLYVDERVIEQAIAMNINIAQNYTRKIAPIRPELHANHQIIPFSPRTKPLGRTY